MGSIYFSLFSLLGYVWTVYSKYVWNVWNHGIVDVNDHLIWRGSAFVSFLGQIPVPTTKHRQHRQGVSENRGTPKSSILIGFSIINHPFWDNPYFLETPTKVRKLHGLRFGGISLWHAQRDCCTTCVGGGFFVWVSGCDGEGPKQETVSRNIFERFFFLIFDNCNHYYIMILYPYLIIYFL